MTDEELGRLLSLISHEVRNPLGVIRGYLRLLDQQGAGLPEHHRHAVAAALRAGERAAEILGQVSVLARLYRREAVVAPRRASLEALLRSAAHAVLMPPEPIVTLHVVDVPPVAIVADEELLRIALAGLTGAVVRGQLTDSRVLLTAAEHSEKEQPGVLITIGSAGPAASDTMAQLNISRGGLALDLPLAVFIVDAHRGRVRERRDGDRLTGIELWLPQ